MVNNITESSGNIFSDIGFDAENASSLKVRADLMIRIKKIIALNKWSQVEAAGELHVTQPRISDLLRGKIDLFSIDTLIDMLAKLGERTVVVSAEDAEKYGDKKNVNSFQPVKFSLSAIGLVAEAGFEASSSANRILSRTIKTLPNRDVSLPTWIGSMKSGVFEVAGNSNLIRQANSQLFAMIAAVQDAPIFHNAKTMNFSSAVN